MVHSIKVAVARNTVLNLIGMALPLAVGVFVMPVIVGRLGTARFGLLGLAWAMLEYFTLFDVGLGRATTKFVAERMARGADDVTDVIGVSILTQAGVGLLGGIALALTSPFLRTHVLHVPPQLSGEAGSVLLVLAITLPFVLLAATLRGILEAAQRFDLSNLIRVPSSVASFVIPAIAAMVGLSLPSILWYMLCARVVTCVITAIVIHRSLRLRFRTPRRWRLLPSMLSFGGWVSVSNVVSPVLVYLDRFMLSALVGLAAVGYYTGPYEMAIRLLILPSSLVVTLFPLVSSMGALDDRARIARAFGGAVRNLLLVMAPLVVVLGVFAPELLSAWLGPAVAARSSTALRILALGVLINGLAHVPSAHLQALGRPEISARFHLFELVIHVPLTFVLVRAYGIAGAAAAWTTRVSLDAVLLFVATHRLLGIPSVAILGGRGARVTGAMAAMLAPIAAAATMLHGSVVVHASVTALALATFAVVVWRGVMDTSERATIMAFVARFAPAGARR
jgi:O-antigen/teichoic acid export membrane protein